VDLSGQLSNPRAPLCQLADQDIGTPKGVAPEEARPRRDIPRSSSRTARPLKPAQVEALVAGYHAGKTMKELGAQFGINRLTVSAHLRRAGVSTRRGGLGGDHVAEAVTLYEGGWSSARIAERFEVSADSVLKSLRRAGVSIRPRRGGPTAREAC
jgi:DNA-directed RNA polymerase specialized sigma24 family protein